MTPEKKKQTRLLAALVIMLGIAGTYTYMSLRRPAAAAVTPAEKIARVSALPSAGNAQIRLDLLAENLENSAVGRKNVFQYYVPPKPPPPPPPPPPVVNTRPQTPVNTAPPPPQTPPSALTTFKFNGVGIVPKPGKLMVSILDTSTNMQYNVMEGDYILGRYLVTKATDTMVEIQDTDQNRRQTYPRVTT